MSKPEAVTGSETLSETGDSPIFIDDGVTMRNAVSGSRTTRRFFSIILLAAIAILPISCGTLRALEPGATGERPVQSPALRGRLVEGANTLLGKSQLIVRGKRFSFDCTGTVLAIYWYAGIDLSADFGSFTGNGVARLYKSLGKRGLLYDTRHPTAGDIVFWDDTYDANGDGIWNDDLTHVGMVVKTDRGGVISYVHQNVRKGIVIEYMDLLRPSVPQWNSPMRMAEPGVVHPQKWLSGQLYRSFGKGYLF
jgi:hypothetical protein